SEPRCEKIALIGRTNQLVRSGLSKSGQRGNKRGGTGVGCAGAVGGPWSGGSVLMLWQPTVRHDRSAMIATTSSTKAGLCSSTSTSTSRSSTLVGKFETPTATVEKSNYQCAECAVGETSSPRSIWGEIKFDCCCDDGG